MQKKLVITGSIISFVLLLTVLFMMNYTKSPQLVSNSLSEIEVVEIGEKLYQKINREELITNSSTIENVIAQSNYVIYENVADLYQDSDLVVRGTVKGKKLNFITPMSTEEHKLSNPFDGFTLTEFAIEKIIKEDIHYTEKEDKEILQVLEPSLIRDGVRYTYEDYTDLEEGLNYILFLVYSPPHDAYWIHALYQGKYNLDDQDIHEIQISQTNEHYHELKKEVIELFAK